MQCCVICDEVDIYENNDPSVVRESAPEALRFENKTDAYRWLLDDVAKEREMIRQSETCFSVRDCGDESGEWWHFEYESMLTGCTVFLSWYVVNLLDISEKRGE